ncbi:MAG TPA: hypothetical protein VGD79_13395 [Thermoanaerobaculia bacterium]|jgi:hypothetical protein
MQGFRKYALVVSLSAALIATVATNATVLTAQRTGSVNIGIIARVLRFFGIAAQSRFSIPPGDKDEGRWSLPPGEGVEPESRWSIPPG